MFSISSTVHFYIKKEATSCFHQLPDALDKEKKKGKTSTNLEFWAWGRSPGRQERKTEQRELHRTRTLKVPLNPRQASCAMCRFFWASILWLNNETQPFEWSEFVQKKGIKAHFLAAELSEILWGSLNGWSGCTAIGTYIMDSCGAAKSNGCRDFAQINIKMQGDKDELSL